MHQDPEKKKHLNSKKKKSKVLLRVGLVTVETADTCEKRRTEAHSHSVRVGQLLEFWLVVSVHWETAPPLFYYHKQQLQLDRLGL